MASALSEGMANQQSVPYGIAPGRLIALFTAICSFASAAHAQRHSEDCWLEWQAQRPSSPYYGISFVGSNPSKEELQCEIRKLAAKYDVPVEIIAGICAQESYGGYQYDADGYNGPSAGGSGFVVHNVDECKALFAAQADPSQGPPGLGLMQLTGGTAQNLDPDPLISDWSANLEEGVYVLVKYKYNQALQQDIAAGFSWLEEIERDNRGVLENWFYAVAWYRGAPSKANAYATSVYGHIRNPSAEMPRIFTPGFFTPVQVARPESVITEWVYKNPFAARADGTWFDKLHGQRPGPVHMESPSQPCAPVLDGVTIRCVAADTGLPVPWAAATFGSSAPMISDPSGSITIPYSLCGSKPLEIVKGALRFFGIYTVPCPQTPNPRGPRPADGTTATLCLTNTLTCSGLPSSTHFRIGDTVEVFGTGVGLRARGPNACDDPIHTMPDGSIGTIVGSPTCCNGYNRWQIQYNDLPGTNAWSAEGEPNTGEFFLRKVTPCLDITEPNDSSTNATPLTLGQSTNAFICSSTDVDWFKLSVAEPGTLTFNLSVPAENDYDLELFGPDTLYIKGSYGDVGAAETITHNATVAGTYYVRVYGYPVGNGSFNTSSTYTLAADFQPISYATNIFLYFDDFSTPTGLAFNGSAGLSTGTEGTYLRLAPAALYQVGSAFSTNRVGVQQFSTYFAFRFTSPGNGGADGTVFVIQSDSPSALGALGGGMGYGGVPNSLGVEFDIWANTEFPDPNDNHVGIDQNGSVVSDIAFPLPYPLEDSNIHYAWVDYDGSTLEVRVSQSAARPPTPVLTETLSITNVIGSPTAFVGFTAATGGAYANHDVTAWQFNSVFSPINPLVPVRPNVVDQPQSRSVIEAASAVFRVAAGGATPLGYQWQKDGVNIAGAVASSYVTPPATLTDSGAQFRVIITNAFGAVTSSWATLTVTTANTITWTGAVSSDWNNPTNWSPQTVPTASDRVVVNSGNLNAWQASFAVMDFNGASLGGALTNTGTLNWTGGTLRGQLVNGVGAVLAIAGDGDKACDNYYGSGRVFNDGTMIWAGAGRLLTEGDSSYGSIPFENRAGGVWEIQGDSQTASYGGNYPVSFAFTNRGVLRKTGGLGTTTFGQCSFANQGTIEVRSGTLAFSRLSSSGAMTVASGATLRFVGGDFAFSSGGSLDAAPGGTLDYQSGYFSFDPGFSMTATTTNRLAGNLTFYGSVNLSNFELAGGSLGGSFTNTGTLSWTGGTLRGQLVNGVGAVLAIAGDGDKACDNYYGSGRVFNEGTMIWSGAGRLLTAGDSSYGSIPFENRPGGVWEIQGDSQTASYGGNYPVSFAFTNRGVLRKTGGLGTTTFGQCSFANQGTIEVRSGTIAFSRLSSSGVINTASGARVNVNTGSFDAGAAFTGAGLVHLAENISGTLSGQSFLIDGETVYGTFTIAGTLNWTGGAVSGQMTIGSGGVLNLSGGADKFVGYYGTTLTNAGTVNWSGSGRLYALDPGCCTLYRIGFVNAAGGVFNVMDDSGFVGYGGWVIPTFTNWGTFRKVSGAGTSAVAWPFYNFGTVGAQSGTLSFNQSYTQTAGATVLSGGALASASPVYINGGELTGSGFINGPVVNAARLSPGTAPGLLTINGDYTQTSSGALEIELGGTSPGTQFDQLNVTGAASLDGALNVSLINGFRPGSGSAFPILTCGSCTGQFASTGGLTLGGVRLSPAYASTSVTLNAVADVQAVLGSIGVQANRHFELRLMGAPGQSYSIQASSNLVDWATLLTTNTPSGVLDFTDSEAAHFPQRFYRAVSQ